MKKILLFVMFFTFALSFYVYSQEDLLNEKLEFLVNESKFVLPAETSRGTIRGDIDSRSGEMFEEEAEDGDIVYDVLFYLQKMNTEEPEAIDPETKKHLNFLLDEVGDIFSEFYQNRNNASKEVLYEELSEILNTIIDDILLVKEVDSRSLSRNNRENMVMIQERDNVRVKKAKITGNVVNIRTGPSTSYKVMAKLNRGEEVDVLEEGSWTKIKIPNGKIGFVYSKLIKTFEVDSVQSEMQSKGTIKVSRANVRSGPGTDYSVVNTYSYGQVVNITGQDGSWYRIKLNNSNDAYIFSELVYIDENTSGKYKGRITVSGANIRKGPGTAFKVLCTLKNGDIITILDDKTSWVKIETPDNGVGYIYKKLFTKIEENIDSGNTSSGNAQDSKQKAYIAVKAANIRTGPSTSYKRLTTLYYGAEITIISVDGKWSEILTPNNKKGFIYNTLYSKDEASDVPVNSVKADRIVRSALGAVGKSDKIFGFDCYNSATAHGKLACAAVVSAILRNARSGLNKTLLYCPYLRDELKRIGFKTINRIKDFKKGDICFWTKRSGDRPRHVGVIVQKDVYGKWWAVDNSSSRLKVLKRPLLRSYYPIVLPSKRPN